MGHGHVTSTRTKGDQDTRTKEVLVGLVMIRSSRS